MTSTISRVNRVHWIDLAKGFGIMLVLLAHTPIPSEVKPYYYAFVMPMFFWLAGLFFKSDLSFGRFVKDKALRLLVPYFLFSFVSYGCWLVVRQFSRMAAAIDPRQPLLGIFYGVGSGDWMPHNTPLWFLPCLFISMVVLYALVRWTGRWIVTGIVACSVLGFAMIDALDVRLPWSVDVALVSVVFVGLGVLCRPTWLKAAPMRGWLLWSLIAVWLSAAWLNAQSIQRVDINNAVLGNYYLFYAAALAGMLVFADAMKRLPSIPWVEAIGRASLPILCMHMLVYLMVTALAKKALHLQLALTDTKLAVVNPDLNQWAAVLLYFVPGLLLPYAVASGYGWLRREISARRMSPIPSGTDPETTSAIPELQLSEA